MLYTIYYKENVGQKLMPRITKELREETPFKCIYPEGVELLSQADGKQKLYEYLGAKKEDRYNGESCFNVRREDGVHTYFDIFSYPVQYKEKGYSFPMSHEELLAEFYNDITGILNRRGYKTEPCWFGLKACTGVDTWIIGIKDANGIDSFVRIYHKNNWGVDRDGLKGGIPGYHIQCEGRMTADGAVQVMLGHRNKWKPKKQELASAC